MEKAVKGWHIFPAMASKVLPSAKPPAQPRSFALEGLEALQGSYWTITLNPLPGTESGCCEKLELPILCWAWGERRAAWKLSSREA